MSKDKRTFFTPKELKEYQNEISSKTVCLCLACLMDEYDFDKDDIVAFCERFVRYNDAVNNKIISIQKVKEILEEHIDMNIRW